MVAKKTLWNSQFIKLSAVFWLLNFTSVHWKLLTAVAHIKNSMLYKHCCSVMTKGPHLNAGCFLMFTTVNTLLPSIEPLCTSTVNERRTSYIVDVPAIKLSTGAHWMSLIALACGTVCFYCVCVLVPYCLCGSETAEGRAAVHTYSSNAVTFTHPRCAVQDATGDPSSDITIVRRLLCISCCQIFKEEIL